MREHRPAPAPAAKHGPFRSTRAYQRMSAPLAFRPSLHTLPRRAVVWSLCPRTLTLPSPTAEGEGPAIRPHGRRSKLLN